jgi:hypothetical protein
VGDRLAIDEQYNLKTNFPAPAPRADYLKYVAWRTLRKIRSEARLSDAFEKTALRGFFRYELAPDHSVARAIGVRNPVEGKIVELGPQGLVGEGEEDLLARALLTRSPATGDLENLGRHILEGELGRGPRAEEELTYFLQLPRESPAMPLGPSGTGQPLVEALETPVEIENRAPSSMTASNLSNLEGNIQPRGLVIERVPKDN